LFKLGSAGLDSLSQGGFERRPRIQGVGNERVFLVHWDVGVRLGLGKKA
jgi:hypothetical protein